MPRKRAITQQQQEQQQEKKNKNAKKSYQEIPADATAPAEAATITTAVITFCSLPDTLTDPGWREVLQPLFQTDSWRRLTEELNARVSAGETVYPPVDRVFRAFNLTPLSSVRVVILGQDPYHGPGQADGLAFSFSGDPGKLPPSLKMIFKELQADVAGLAAPKSGSLEKWAKQGVLLLNTALTVAKGKPGSHAKLGWAEFTDGTLSRLSSRTGGGPIVFLLWGKPAQSKEQLLTTGSAGRPPHVVLTAVHPSPMAGDGFSGCRHFSKANESLLPTGSTIDWRLD